MKKAATRKPRARRSDDRDTLRPQYDFSKGVRGVTAARYAKGTNVVVVDPDVLDVFPDAESVNGVLRVLAEVIRRQRRKPRSV